MIKCVYCLIACEGKTSTSQGIFYMTAELFFFIFLDFVNYVIKMSIHTQNRFKI